MKPDITKKEYEEPCREGCYQHKYHCAKCNTAVSYSPANYASRPQDIPNSCKFCYQQFEKEECKHCWNKKHRNEQEIDHLDCENCCECGVSYQKNYKHPEPSRENWEIEFEKKFVLDFVDRILCREFIRQTILSERTALVEEIKNKWEIGIDKDLRTSHSLVPLEDIINLIAKKK